MDFNHINSFLEKFKKLLVNSQTTQDVIIETISLYIKFPINKEMISVKGNVIYIKASPVLKTEILLYKDKIITDIKKTLPEKNFIEIR